MNVHLLKAGTMARIADKNKVERLKESTMKLVVEKGFGGASAILITKDAKVASGYFYLHYKSKYEMVNAILQNVYSEVVDKLEELIQKSMPFSDMIEQLIRHFVGIANKEPIKVKFLYVLTNDYNFIIDRKIHDNTIKFITQLKEYGHSSGMLDPKLNENDLYLILVTNTLQFINHYYKAAGENIKIPKKDEDHLLYMINKILK